MSAERCDRPLRGVARPDYSRDYYARNKDKIAALQRDYKVRRVLRELEREAQQPKNVRPPERHKEYEQRLVRVGRGWGTRV